ncbi:hypothetical protein SEA_GODONK_106 [Gordonia phage GodonK]|uniref:Uncharacterized protein n=1 Tax=Gordonia phage GodonK TaxID=2562192 RepID=A0A4D6E442_9CAUD|nr:hypothetical protein HOV33_gp106 [Gordonia phage GodonK]QBZ72725.1 hypothetical protein SEA_GODONK_106 [Gordonia phage GodonK]
MTIKTNNIRNFPIEHDSFPAINRFRSTIASAFHFEYYTLNPSGSRVKVSRFSITAAGPAIMRSTASTTLTVKKAEEGRISTYGGHVGRPDFKTATPVEAFGEIMSAVQIAMVTNGLNFAHEGSTEIIYAPVDTPLLITLAEKDRERIEDNSDRGAMKGIHDLGHKMYSDLTKAVDPALDKLFSKSAITDEKIDPESIIFDLVRFAFGDGTIDSKLEKNVITKSLTKK